MDLTKKSGLLLDALIFTVILFSSFYSNGVTGIFMAKDMSVCAFPISFLYSDSFFPSALCLWVITTNLTTLAIIQLHQQNIRFLGSP